MNDEKTSLTRRLWQRIFPSTPDFYALLNAQCELVVRGTGELVDYMRAGKDAHADAVLELEHQGDKLKARNMTVLHRAFATPMDREDIYHSIAAIDEIINYAKATVREMRSLKLGPDEHTLAMAQLMHQGAQALQRGYAKLSKEPLQAEDDAELARKTERATEKVYRTALTELFDADHYVATLTPEQRKTAESLDVLMSELTEQERTDVSLAVGFVVEILKRREVYRHMSNGADKVVRAGEVLHDIVAKIA